MTKYLPKLLTAFGWLQCLYTLVNLIQALGLLLEGGLAFILAALGGCASSLGTAVLFFAAARILVLLEEKGTGEP